jgi:hypothetical protein
VAAVLMVGGGVSAAVTGQSPLDGISQVASQLPGIGSSSGKHRSSSAQEDLEVASAALRHHDAVGAKRAFDSARTKLAKLPVEQQAALSAQVMQVARDINTIAPGTVTTVPVPGAVPAGPVASVPEATVQPPAPVPPTTDPAAPGPSVTAPPPTSPNTPDSPPTTTASPSETTTSPAPSPSTEVSETTTAPASPSPAATEP